MRTSVKIGVNLFVVLAALASIARVTCGADEPLRWKFTVGQKLDYNMVQEMNMSAAGGPIGQMNTTMRQEMNMTWDVQGVDAKSGEAVIKQKFDRVKMKMTTPVGGFEYDSKSEAAPTGLGAMIAPMYKAMTQGEFEITMTSRGEVKDVKVPEEVLAALKASPAAASMGDIATADGFKKMISQGALVLPENPPKQGDTWSTKIEMNNPAVGKQTVETTYTYIGTKEIDGTMYAVIKPQLKMDFGDWKEVITLKGSGMKKSETFALKGGDTRIRYSYKGDAGTATGVFAVFVIEDGKDIDKAGGIPEVTTQAVSEQSESALHKDAGRYYLNVTAAGDWVVTVEEKPPQAPPAGQPQQPPQQQQLQMKIAEQNSDGEVLFNIKEGRLYTTTLNQKVTIDATVAGQTMQQKIDQKIDVKVTPAGEKKAEEAKPEEAKKTEASEEKK